MNRLKRIVFDGLLWGLASVCASSCFAAPQDQKDPWHFGDRSKVGTISAPAIDESSGLSASQQFPNHFWTHNDGGSTKGLFLLNEMGKLRAQLQLPDQVPFRDWEDMACVSIDGTSYLIVGDVGDNRSVYKSSRLYVFKEPQFQDLPDASVALWKVDQVATVEFTFADGPRNCESMAVDTKAGRVYLVSKLDAFSKPESKATLHWIPLMVQSSDEPLVAQPLPWALNRRMLTGMSISADGNLAVIRSYTSAWLFRREPDQTWPNRFNRDPDASLFLPLQKQGEAIAFGMDNRSVFLTSEGVNQAFWKIEIQEPSTHSTDK